MITINESDSKRAPRSEDEAKQAKDNSQLDSSNPRSQQSHDSSLERKALGQ